MLQFILFRPSTVAEILLEAFGDRIARSPPPALLAHVANHAHSLATGRPLASPAAAFALAQELLPSPRALAGKVLVKAKLKSPGLPLDGRRPMTPSSTATMAAVQQSPALAAGSLPGSILLPLSAPAGLVPPSAVVSKDVSVPDARTSSVASSDVPSVVATDPPAQQPATPARPPGKLLTAGSLSSLLLPRPMSGTGDNVPAAATASAALWDLVYLRTFKMPASADTLAALQPTAAAMPQTAFTSTSLSVPASAGTDPPPNTTWAGTGQSCYHMCSLKEPRAGRLLAGVGAESMIEYTSRRLLRVYPGPLRLDSSNFNPVPYWAAGVQVRVCGEGRLYIS